MEENKRQVNKRKFLGKVVSTAMNKTIVVCVITMKLHPKFKKQYQTSKRFYVHDEKGEAKAGDRVRFMECRPLSKTKRWRLIEIIK